MISVNGSQIRFSVFPGGECHVNISDVFPLINQVNHIHASLYSSDDILCLLLTINALRQNHPTLPIKLTIPYFPYARQDRVCRKGEAFSLEVMAALINRLDCQEVVIFDPHSPVTLSLVHHSSAYTQAAIIQDSFLAKYIKDNDLVLVSPDAGAKQKVTELGEALNVATHKTETLNAEIIYCSKIRNSDTGRVTGVSVPDNVTGKNLIVLDDICDGGRTFTELGSALKNNGANDLYLYVTHGIFSKGLDVLKESFNHVYCFHSLAEKESTFLTILGE